VGAPGEAGADRFVEVADTVTEGSGSLGNSMWIRAEIGRERTEIGRVEPQVMAKKEVIKAQKVWRQVRR
jgi:hypothetical protein